MHTPTLALLVGTFTLAACSEDPSVHLRWQITQDPALVYGADPDQVTPLRSAKDCSEVGIQRVRVNFYKEDTSFQLDPLLSTENSYVSLRPPLTAMDYWDLVEKEKTFSCFPPQFLEEDALVSGPALDPGRYVAHVLALRRDGTPWPCLAADSNYQAQESDNDSSEESIACAAGYEKTGETERRYPHQNRIENGVGIPLDSEGETTSDPSKYTYETIYRTELFANCQRICAPGYQLSTRELCTVCPGYSITDPFSVDNNSSYTFEKPIVLLAPPQCDDGIDNDGDGRIDETDPACIYDNTLDENMDASVTLFSLELELLGSPQTRCEHLGIDHLQATIDGEIELADLPCDAKIPLFGKSLDPGEHTLHLTAMDADNQALTITKILASFIVEETKASYVADTVQFLSSDFLETIRSPINIVLVNSSYPNSGFLWSCAPPVSIGGLLGEVDSINLQIRDAEGSILNAASLGIQDAVDDSNGGILLPYCPSSAVQSLELDWGMYSIEAQANLGDNQCFSTEEPFLLAPNERFPIVMHRILDDQGVPPEACWDCRDDQDCGPGYLCNDHLCTLP